jgi:hypothetical protein
MSALSLLSKLEEEAQIEREERCEKRLQAYVHFKPRPKSRAEVKRNKLFELRRRNNQIRCELDTDRQLVLETKRHEEASLQLYRSNRTPAQKPQQEEDTQRMATWASSICAEASLSWRQDAQEKFNAKKL